MISIREAVIVAMDDKSYLVRDAWQAIKADQRIR